MPPLPPQSPLRRGNRLPVPRRQPLSRRPVAPADVVWHFSGVRPLYDDGHGDPADVTRDYTFVLDTDPQGQTPLLSIFGGKLTTHRKLAEAALARLAPWFPQMGPQWTDSRPCPAAICKAAELRRAARRFMHKASSAAAAMDRASGAASRQRSCKRARRRAIACRSRPRFRRRVVSARGRIFHRTRVGADGR